MKNVVITGSTKGIGLGLAKAFLAQGCNVLISGRNPDTVKSTVSQLRRQFNLTAPPTANSSPFVIGQACDISDYDQVQELWDYATLYFATVDIWINNAGMNIGFKPLWEVERHKLQQLMDTNVNGLVFANRVAVAGMTKQFTGQIWNMEGFGSNGMTQPGMTSYGATKCFLSYFTKSMSKELKDSGVHIGTLSPGIVVTDLLTSNYDLHSKEWEKSKKIFNILADTVDTVAPFLVKGILASTKNGDSVTWLTKRKAMYRFMKSLFTKRYLFTELEAGITT